MRRPPFVLALLIVAVLAAGIVGVVIHAPSSGKPTGVAAPPTAQETTQETTSTTEPPASTTTVFAPVTSTPALSGSSTGNSSGTGSSRPRSTARSRTVVLGTRTFRSTQRPPALPSTGRGSSAGTLAGGGLLLLSLLVRVRLRSSR